MCPLLNSQNNKRDKSMAQISLLAAVPAMLIAGPAVGFIAGQWLDKKFDSDPVCLLIGLILGFATAGREIYRLVQKAQALEEKKDDDTDGT